MNMNEAIHQGVLLDPTRHGTAPQPV